MDKTRLEEMFRLDERVAIITGGSRGIGRSIAETFALSGARVVIASRKEDDCEQTADAINQRVGRSAAIAITANTSHLDQLQNLVDTTVSRLGGIDILVNNAANALALPFGEITVEGWQKSLDVNLRGPIFLTQYALGALTASEHASVINISSAAAYLFSAFTHIYACGKAGLLASTRALAQELAPKEIRVNAIAPGTIDTEMVRNNAPEVQEVMAKAALLGRAAEPDEIAGLALYLASDASSFVTGATINVDGGLVPR